MDFWILFMLIIIIIFVIIAVFVGFYYCYNRKTSDSETSDPIPNAIIVNPIVGLQQNQNSNQSSQQNQNQHNTAAQIRITKEMKNLKLPKKCSIVRDPEQDLLNFKIIICPDEGKYEGRNIIFSFKLSQTYPYVPPKVKCETRVHHSNIDLNGQVTLPMIVDGMSCANVLGDDWKPGLTISSIVYGLQYLFLEPNPENPLNTEAAEVLQTNRRLFQHKSETLKKPSVAPPSTTQPISDKTQ